MKPSEVLRAAADKLSPPESWIQGDYARDERRRPTDPRYLEATCWCSTGAIVAVTPWNDAQLRIDARRYLARAIQRPSEHDDIDGEIVDWNDEPGRRHGEVLEAFLRAAELAERDGR